MFRALMIKGSFLAAVALVAFTLAEAPSSPKVTPKVGTTKVVVNKNNPVFAVVDKSAETKISTKWDEFVGYLGGFTKGSTVVNNYVFHKIDTKVELKFPGTKVGVKTAAKTVIAAR